MVNEYIFIFINELFGLPLENEVEFAMYVYFLISSIVKIFVGIRELQDLNN